MIVGLIILFGIITSNIQNNHPSNKAICEEACQEEGLQFIEVIDNQCMCSEQGIIKEFVAFIIRNHTARSPKPLIININKGNCTILQVQNGSIKPTQIKCEEI